MTVHISKYQQVRWLDVYASLVTKCQPINEETAVGSSTANTLVRKGVVLVNALPVTPAVAFTKIGFYTEQNTLVAAVNVTTPVVGAQIPAGQLIVGLGE